METKTKIYTAIWHEEGEVSYQLRSDECDSKAEAGDSDWWFDRKTLMFRRYWSYHDELYGLQIVREKVKAELLE